MSNDPLSPRDETEAEPLERLGWMRLMKPASDTLGSIRGLRAAVVSEIHEQVAGGDLASLAERLDDVSGWQEGILQRLGALERWKTAVCATLDGLTAPEPPQTPAERAADAIRRDGGTPAAPAVAAERRTGKELADMRAADDPCPFCGAGTPSYLARVAPDDRAPEHWYECMACNARGPRVRMEFTGDPQMEALKLWRARAAAPALPVDGEREAYVRKLVREFGKRVGPNMPWTRFYEEADRLTAALLRALPSEGERAAECGDQYQGSVCRLPRGHAGAHWDPDVDSEEGRGAAWADAPEPGAPTVEARFEVRNSYDRLIDERSAAHAALTAAGVPNGTLAERMEELAAERDKFRRESRTNADSWSAACDRVMELERQLLLAQRGPEGERYEAFISQPRLFLERGEAPAREALCERCHVTPTEQWAPLCEACLPQCRREWNPQEVEEAPPGVYSLRHLREAWLDGWERAASNDIPDEAREECWYEFTHRAGTVAGDAPAAEGGAS